MCAVAMVTMIMSSVYVSVSATDSPMSGRGFGRGPNLPIEQARCYKVCPSIVYPTGHDPYYDTSYFSYEREMHGGPFGPVSILARFFL